MLTHYKFIESFQDTDRFNAAIREMVNLKMISQQETDDWSTNRRTSRGRLKCLLNALESIHTENLNTRLSPELKSLVEIVNREKMIRNGLSAPSLWRSIFLQAQINIDGPILIEPINNAGHVNYTYRICGGANRYFIRYHDPLGRKFLQPLEPGENVSNYLVVQRLFKVALHPGMDDVVSTEFPTSPENRWSSGYRVDEDAAPIPDIVVDRILIQTDYSVDHFLLSDYADQNPILAQEDVVELYVRPLAFLHARSCCLKKRANHPVSGDPLAEILGQYRSRLRFQSSNDYHRWLTRNWIGKMVGNLSNCRPNHNTVLFHLLNELEYQPDDFVNRCQRLWQQSAEAMESVGALAHLDYKPGNCFVNKDARDHLKLFDFDYLAIIDPAYEIGLSLCRLVKLILQKGRGDPAEEIIAFFLKRYEHYYGILLTIPDFPNLLSRARVFAGLAISADLDSDHADGRPTGLSEVRKKNLLQSSKRLLDELRAF